MPGYSSKPLWAKLGVKEVQRRLIKNTTALDVPDYLAGLDFAEAIANGYGPGLEFIHVYVDSRQVLAAELAALLPVLDRAGVIWISWPKKAAKQPTDISEDTIRELALPLGLVDVKVCSVSDELWSGLKLVIRRELR